MNCEQDGQMRHHQGRAITFRRHNSLIPRSLAIWATGAFFFRASSTAL